MRKEVEIEDVFLDRLAQKREKENLISSKRLETPLDKKAFFGLLVAGFFIFCLLTGFTFYLQIQGKEKYESLAQQNRFVNSNIAATRGVIYDRNKIPLVENESSFDLWLKKSALPGDREEYIIGEVALSLKKSPDIIKEQIRSANQDDILIEKNLNHEQLVLLSVKEQEITGFRSRKNIVRHYQEPQSLSHILGYLGKISPDDLTSLDLADYNLQDYIGKSGVEKTYEKILKENKGLVNIQRTAQGKIVSQEIVEYPSSGNSLVLSLDLALQKKAEQILSSMIKESGSKKEAGVVIIMDYSNGEIMAMVSLPTFDNNLFSGGISQDDFQKILEKKNNPQFNRSIAGLYPTGSTAKPFVGLGALEEGLISEQTTIYCPENLCVAHQFDDKADCYPDWKYHGPANITRAIAESVNPFFYIIGGGYTAPKRASSFYNERLPKKFEGLGALRIAQYLSLFGFGKETGIDLPSELAGRVPTPEWKQNYFKTPASQKWYLGDSYNLSIGQGYFLATPLQVAQAFGAIANNGKMFRPKLGKEIITPDGKTQEIPSVLIKESFVSSSSLAIMRAAMKETVVSPVGSAHILNSLPVSVAAKTGTAQIYPNKDIFHNWVAAFTPFAQAEIKNEKNRPLVIVVLIEEVPGLSRIAVRAAYDILEWYYYTRHLKAKPAVEPEPPATTTNNQ